MLRNENFFVSFLWKAIFILMVFSVVFFFLFFPKEEVSVKEIEKNYSHFDAFSCCLGKTIEQVIGIIGEPTEIIYVSNWSNPISPNPSLIEKKEKNYCQIIENFHSQKLLLTLIYILGEEKIYLVFSPKEEIVKTIVFRSTRDPVPFDRIFKEISD